MQTNLNVIIPTENNVKRLGRTYILNHTIWCALSATGIEFILTGKKCDITFVGDNMVKVETGEEHYARIAIYVNDDLILDDFIKMKSQTFSVFDSDLIQTVVIRVVKLSESSDSTMGIKFITTDASDIHPTANKELKIEFIGDSITCGYGVEGVLGDLYATANENATKAYAYLTAKALDADYSLVSYSGYGIISGYTDNGVIQEDQILPKYYTKLGHSFGAFDSFVAPDTVEWDFTSFIPNIIVINLGTNDYSYCGSDEEHCLKYQGAYVDFIKVVRKNNPDSKIFCTLGIMGLDLFPYIQNAVNQYIQETSDTNIQTFQFIPQNEKDGYAVDYHPTAVTHKNAALVLKEYLNSFYKE